jgi:hypothetical protein
MKQLTTTWVAYLQKITTYIIDTYITTYLPSGVHAFNVAWVALHTLDNVFTSRGMGPQNIPRSSHPRCAVMASHMTDTQSILPNMDCSQASLVLRGWVSSKPRLENTGPGFTSLDNMNLPPYFVVERRYRIVNCIK